MNPPTARSRSLLAAAIIGGGVFVVSLLLILGGAKHTRSVFDQDHFHFKVIQRFNSQWPRFDFRDYESATTPGYHVVIATVNHFLTRDVTGLRLTGALFTIGFLATFAWWLAPRVGTARAVVLTLPLAASMYVLFPAVWLLPDNAAWWALLGLLLVTIHPSPVTPARAVLAASLLVLLLMTRQVHIWAVAPLVTAWWLAWPESRSDPTDRAAGLWPPTGEFRPALGRVVAAIAICIPAILLLAAFARLWHGLTPPTFQPAGSALTTPDATRVSGVSPATPAFILALFGIFGSFFAGFLWRTLRRRSWVLPALSGAAVALLAAVLPRTDYSHSDANPDMSRFSGVWNLVKALTPEDWRTSPVIVVPAALGGAWLALWFRALPRREAWILAAALLGFVAAHTAGALSWQRYFEPMVLILLIIAASLVWRKDTPRWAIAGPIALALLQAGNTVLSLMRDG